MLDIISIGDVTTDVFLQVDDLILKCEDHGKKNCLLCMKYADKIVAKRVDKLIGGNAGNIAIGSKRLGLKSALYAQVGNDDQGEVLLKSLKKDNVSTKYFTLAKNELTNYFNRNFNSIKNNSSDNCCRLRIIFRFMENLCRNNYSYFFNSDAKR